MTDFYTRLTDKESAYGTDPTTGLQSYRVKRNTVKYRPVRMPIRTVETGVEVQRTELTRDISTGSVVMNAHLDKKFARWFAMLMGKETYSLSNTSVGNHVFSFLPLITNSQAYPSFTMRKAIGLEERPYTGVFAQRGVFSQKQNNLLELAFDLTGKKVGANASTGTLSDFSTQKYLSNAHIVTQTIGGGAVKFEDFSIEVNGPAIPAFKGGSTDVDSADLQPASVKFRGSIRFLTNTHLADFVAGTARALVIKYDTGVQIPSSSPSTNYTLQFDLFKLIYDDADVEIDEQKRVVQVLNGELEQDGSGNLFKITVQDETTSAYV